MFICTLQIAGPNLKIKSLSGGERAASLRRTQKLRDIAIVNPLHAIKGILDLGPAKIQKLSSACSIRLGVRTGATANDASEWMLVTAAHIPCQQNRERDLWRLRIMA